MRIPAKKKEMKQIELTKGQFALVDDEDFEKLNSINWIAIKPRNKFYAVHNNSKNHKTYMHRMILDVTSKGQYVDHIDGNGINNQRYNLRICSNAQNLMNRGLNKNNSSGFKGVYFSNSKNCWVAQIKVNRKKITRLAKTATEAAKKYNDLAVQFFGEFAVLNNV